MQPLYRTRPPSGGGLRPAAEPSRARYPLRMDRPEITYPCRWTYRIVGTDAPSIRRRVEAVAGARPHELAPSQESSKGNYVSLRFEIEVTDQADRDRIFAVLQADPSIKMVL